jgi:hypothetical protein
MDPFWVAMAVQAQPEMREVLRRELLRELGSPSQVIILEQRGDRHMRGVVVCSGRVLSFVLDAQSQRLRTRPLFDLLLRSRA